MRDGVTVCHRRTAPRAPHGGGSALGVGAGAGGRGKATMSLDERVMMKGVAP